MWSKLIGEPGFSRPSSSDRMVAAVGEFSGGPRACLSSRNAECNLFKSSQLFKTCKV